MSERRQEGRKIRVERRRERIDDESSGEEA